MCNPFIHTRARLYADNIQPGGNITLLITIRKVFSACTTGARARLLHMGPGLVWAAYANAKAPGEPRRRRRRGRRCGEQCAPSNGEPNVIFTSLHIVHMAMVKAATTNTRPHTRPIPEPSENPYIHNTNIQTEYIYNTDTVPHTIWIYGFAPFAVCVCSIGNTNANTMQAPGTPGNVQTTTVQRRRR